MSTATSADTDLPEPRSKPTRRRTFYRGDPGMWSWLLHRISGATIFFFLFVHVLDTALVRVSPQAYNEIIETYKSPIIGLMEIGLVAAVLYIVVRVLIETSRRMSRAERYRFSTPVQRNGFDLRQQELEHRVVHVGQTVL